MVRSIIKECFFFGTAFANESSIGGVAIVYSGSLMPDNFINNSVFSN